MVEYGVYAYYDGKIGRVQIRIDMNDDSIGIIEIGMIIIGLLLFIPIGILILIFNREWVRKRIDNGSR